jgi:hypothetical protein
MRHKLPRRSLRSVALCMAGCAVRPGVDGIDGGIVGTGNRIDCEALAKKDRTGATAPEECRGKSGMTLPPTGN